MRYNTTGGQLVSEFTDAASATYSSPTWPGSAPADTASTLLYQHSDHLTTRVTTDNAGTLSNQQAHYPYGENWYASGTADDSVTRKFTSYRKEMDYSLASGQINYAVARYFGARVGRFHRPDPVRGRIRNPQRRNRYAYVTGDPIRHTDPRGLDFVDLGDSSLLGQDGDGSQIIPRGGGNMTYAAAGGGGVDHENAIDDMLVMTGGAINPGDQMAGFIGWINSIGPQLGMGGDEGSGSGTGVFGGSGWQDDCRRKFGECIGRAGTRQQQCMTGPAVTGQAAYATCMFVAAQLYGALAEYYMGATCREAGQVVTQASESVFREFCQNRRDQDDAKCMQEWINCGP